MKAFLKFKALNFFKAETMTLIKDLSCFQNITDYDANAHKPMHYEQMVNGLRRVDWASVVSFLFETAAYISIHLYLP